MEEARALQSTEDAFQTSESSLNSGNPELDKKGKNGAKTAKMATKGKGKSPTSLKKSKQKSAISEPTRSSDQKSKQKSPVSEPTRSNDQLSDSGDFDTATKTNVSQENGGLCDLVDLDIEQPGTSGVNLIVTAMRAGFNELSEKLCRDGKRQKPILRDASPPLKRARHESLSDSSISSGDDKEHEVDEDIDELLKDTPPSDGKEEDQQDDKPEDIFGELEEEYDLDEKCGPEVRKQLATIVNKMARTKLTEELLKEKLNKFNRPKNCDKLVATKVNPEIWGKITSTTRSRDVKLQKVQAVLLKATSGLTHVADKLCQQDKDAMKTILNSIALITHANCDLNHRRRDLIKPDLNRSYQQLCSEQVQATDLLFGDDLAQKIKDINTTNRVGNRLLDNPKHYKTSYYGHDTHRKSGYSKNGQRTSWRGGHKKWYNNRNNYQSHSQKKKDEGRGEK